MLKHKIPVFAAGACLLFVAGSVRADDEKTVTLANPLKAGDSVRYKNTSVIDIGGMEITLEQTQKRTVKDVKESGEITVIVAEEGGKVNFGAGDTEIPPSEPTTIIQAKSGKISSFKPESENMYLSVPTRHLMVLGERVVLPDKPVKAGDSWTTEIDNPAVKGKKVTIKTTYIGPDKVDGAAAWKLKQTMEAATEGGKMTAETTSLLDASNGQLLSAELVMKAIPANNGPIDLKGKIVRVKAEAKAAK